MAEPKQEKKEQNEYQITVSNAINEMRRLDMGLEENRIYLSYLAKIDPTDIRTRRVVYPLKEFKKIMNIPADTSTERMKEYTASLLSHVITESDGNGGYRQYQIFSECEVKQDSLGQWNIYITAHDKLVPYLFNLKSMYFSYKLWNVRRLDKPTHIRLYEILKQYERTRTQTLTISIADLKHRLDLNPDDYSRFDNFNSKIIKPCQKVLTEKTDITFDVEKIKDGRAVTGLKFKVRANEAYDHQMELKELEGYGDDFKVKMRSEFSTDKEYEEYCKTLPRSIQDTIIAEEKRLEDIERLKLLVENDFEEKQINKLYDTICKLIPEEEGKDISQIKSDREDRVRFAYNIFQTEDRLGNVKSEDDYGRMEYLIKVLTNNEKEGKKIPKNGELPKKRRGNNVRKTGDEAGIKLDDSNTPVHRLEDETEEERKARLEKNSEIFGIDLTDK